MVIFIYLAFSVICLILNTYFNHYYVKYPGFGIFNPFWLGLLWVLSSCSTEFERVRTSATIQAHTPTRPTGTTRTRMGICPNFVRIGCTVLQRKTSKKKSFFQHSLRTIMQGELSLLITFPILYLLFTTVEQGRSWFHMAYSHYKLSPNYKLDQSYSKSRSMPYRHLSTSTLTANAVSRECNKLMDEMRKKLERKAPTEGLLYYKLGQYQWLWNHLRSCSRIFQVQHLRPKPNICWTNRKAFELAENSIWRKKKKNVTVKP